MDQADRDRLVSLRNRWRDSAEFRRVGIRIPQVIVLAAALWGVPPGSAHRQAGPEGQRRARARPAPTGLRRWLASSVQVAIRSIAAG